MRRNNRSVWIADTNAHGRTAAGQSLWTSPALWVFVVTVLLVVGAAKVLIHSHHSAETAATRNCSVSGLVAYASGQTNKIDAVVEAAATGNVPAEAATCSND